MKNQLTIPSRTVRMRRAITCFCVFLFFFLLFAHVLADDAKEEFKSVSEQPSATYGEDEGAATKDKYAVPRKQVLLELFGRPT
jgi:hypothetical protein